MWKYETAYYFYDACDQVIEMDECNIGGKKLFKTTYSWDAEGNRLSEMQSGSGNGNKENSNSSDSAVSAEVPAVEILSVETEKLNSNTNTILRRIYE